MNSGKFIALNICDGLENKVEGLTVADLKETLSEFSSVDPHVQFFLKNDAEDFARQHKSVTYIRTKLKELRAKFWGRASRWILTREVALASMRLFALPNA